LKKNTVLTDNIIGYSGHTSSKFCLGPGTLRKNTAELACNHLVLQEGICCSLVQGGRSQGPYPEKEDGQNNDKTVVLLCGVINA